MRAFAGLAPAARRCKTFVTIFADCLNLRAWLPGTNGAVAVSRTFTGRSAPPATLAASAGLPALPRPCRSPIAHETGSNRPDQHDRRPHVSLDRFCVPDSRGSRRRAGAACARLRARTRPRGAPRAGAVAVYRDQLHEIEADQARGVLSAGEAEAARLEVSRRLLASAARAERAEPQALRRRARCWSPGTRPLRSPPPSPFPC